MTQHIVATPSPSVPLWRRRTFVVVAGVVVLAVAVGVAVRAVVVSDSTTATQSTHAAVPQVGVPVFDGGPALLDACVAPTPVDGAYLLALIASSPNGRQIAASISPQANRLVSDAAEAAATSPSAVVTSPDAITLFGVLARLGPADRAAVTPLLPTDMQAELAGIGNVAPYLTCG
jgi:hypothetical protein